MQTIAIANHKGGVGKTATTHALGTALGLLGRRVLLIDIDPQSSLTMATGVTSAAGESMAEVMGDVSPGTTKLSDILVDVGDEGATVHLAPADIALAPNELGLTQRYGREAILATALDVVRDYYDVCLIDCPPSLGLLTVNALRAATAVIIATQPQISDLRGLVLFLDTIDQVKQQINPHLKIAGILVTFADGRLIHHQDAISVMNDQNLPLFETTIGRSVRVAEAAAAGESIVTYDPDNPQATNYKRLAKEVDQWLRNEQR